MISIVIIVKNDQRIRILFEKLSKLEYTKKFEIIVVDGSKGVLDEIKNNNPEVKWIYYSDGPENKRTYAQQRNIGINKSNGEIIVFIDADCIPDRNWLKNLVKPIYEDNENIISGAVRPINSKQIHKEENYGKYRDECETMNMSLTRDVLNTVGLFDERLEGGEDSDYCIRARTKGFKIRYQKSAIVYHDWGGFFQNIKRSFNGGKDRVNLYTKHPKILLSLSISNIYTIFYLLYCIFLPVAFFYPYYLLILFFPSIIKMRNPVKEIYNICFALGTIIGIGNVLININAQT